MNRLRSKYIVGYCDEGNTTRISYRRRQRSGQISGQRQWHTAITKCGRCGTKPIRNNKIARDNYNENNHIDR